MLSPEQRESAKQKSDQVIGDLQKLVEQEG